MTAPDLPENLLRFIESTVPTFPAAELLLFMVHHPRRWKPREIVRAIEPAIIAPAAVEEYFALFKANGLIAGQPDEGFQYAPASPELEAAVGTLERAYNERPVTLIRTISMLADVRIRSFADSFKLKEGGR